MKKIFFLGQAPAKPSSKHSIPGTYLHSWLHSAGFSDEAIQANCFFYALTDIFPGSTKSGHLAPTKQQIAAHRATLQQAIVTISPDIIVPVGKMAISEVLGEKRISLNETIGQTFTLNPFNSLTHPIPCIPLSHPSGRSAWNHTHKAQIAAALNHLRDASLLDA